MTILHESRRTAVGMAAQFARRNEDEFDLLLSNYIEDACDGGRTCECRLVALIELASSAVQLAVFTSRDNAEFFTRLAEEMAVRGE